MVINWLINQKTTFGDRRSYANATQHAHGLCGRPVPCCRRAAHAACDKVSFSDVGWTDITATTSLTKHILEALGYKVDVKILAVPVTYASLKSGDIDVFLGNWMPAQSGEITPYLKTGEVENVAVNLEGTKYTLAVPTYSYDAGPEGLQGHRQILQGARQQDLRHRAGQ